jgi:predicted aspartyl protease
VRYFPFDPSQSVLFCHAEIAGRKDAKFSLIMAVDTGATCTTISWKAAIAIGYDPSRSAKTIEITTGSSVEYAPLVTIPKFSVFGVEIKRMKVVCHNLPPQSPVEGLLGLDFLKKAKAVIDFSANTIRLPN